MQRQQLCPICHNTYGNLPRHLTNTEEKMLLLQLSSGRVNGTFMCQEVGCGTLVKRIDRHYMDCHGEMEESDMAYAVAKTKKNFVLSKLADLRATHPEVPMMSVLDVGFKPVPVVTPEAPAEAEAVELCVAEERGSEVVCNNPNCVEAHRRKDEEIKVLKARLGLAGQDCPRSDCKVKERELGRLVRLYQMSPQKRTRKKFSHEDSFSEEHNPKYGNILPRKMSSQFREKVEEVLPKKLGGKPQIGSDLWARPTVPF
ncbi:uncharacterized protein LOC125793107 [Astyanax mexicanus]|uniref:uncharacterized protein LOC125793107 n=1 Tax=Astyanax mexicanus TaxID=7994 RepID=UPI0020CB5825|nr:uncharacterized protein LOC125793107 [Astyanax mexicanus]